MKKYYFLVVALALTSCTTNVDPNYYDDDGGVGAVNTYGGLYVYGKLTIEHNVGADSDVYEGRISLADLISVISSDCMEESVESQDGSINRLKCFAAKDEIAAIPNDSFVHSDNACEAKVCAQHLYLCVGRRLLSLSESVSPVVVKAPPLEYEIDSSSCACRTLTIRQGA